MEAFNPWVENSDAYLGLLTTTLDLTRYSCMAGTCQLSVIIKMVSACAIVVIIFSFLNVSPLQKMLDYLKEKKDAGFFQSLSGLMQSCR